MTGTTQSELSRVSGVRQPSISQFLSGKVDLSDEHLDRLLSCLGYRLEVVRRPVEPKLTRSERRSWQLHRLASKDVVHYSPRLIAKGDAQGDLHDRSLSRAK